MSNSIFEFGVQNINIWRSQIVTMVEYSKVIAMFNDLETVLTRHWPHLGKGRRGPFQVALK